MASLSTGRSSQVGTRDPGKLLVGHLGREGSQPWGRSGQNLGLGAGACLGGPVTVGEL